MKYAKLFFSIFTVMFAIFGLTDTFPDDFTSPIMFAGLAITLLINAKECKDRQQKGAFVEFLLVGLFIIIVTVYNVFSILKL